MLKKNLYKLHRRLSVLIGIPICLWAISGLLHPIMTNIRPQIATQTPPVLKQDQQAMAYNLAPALNIQHIDSFFRARQLAVAGTWYYQVRQTPDGIPLYIKALDGQLLRNGDQRYAAFLARHFLSGSTNNKKQTAIRSIKYLTKFSADYPSVNRILPVYQVEFDRPDDLTIFVSTLQSKFSYARDNNRAAFNWFFGFFHTWSWLDHFPAWKAGIISLILLLTLATAFMGLYIAFTTKSKRSKKHRVVKARRLHRLTAIIAAVFMLAWVFSGLIHAVKNSLPARYGNLLSVQSFSRLDLPADPAAIVDRLQIVGGASRTAVGFAAKDTNPIKITAVEYLSIAHHPYMRMKYQRALMAGAPKASADLMKDQQVTAPRLIYYNLHTHQVLQSGDSAYALKLAKKYLNKKYPGEAAGFNWEAASVSYQTHFDLDYNFSDKVLPVWKISPDGRLSRTVFIHTGTGTLTKEPTVFGRIDAFCFGFFHKHEFMAWAGKSVKDASTIIGVLLVLCMLFFGYRLYFISRIKRKNRS